jgi:integrase
VEGKMAKKGEKEPDFEAESRFAFTPARIDRLRRLVADGEIGLDQANRRQWRDAQCQGLVVVVSRAGNASWQIYRKVDGRPRRKAIGDVDTVQLSLARDTVKRERFDSSVAGKIIGPSANSGEKITVQELFDAYIEAAASGDFVAGSRHRPILPRTERNYRDLYRAQLKPHASKSIRWLAAEIRGLHKRLGSGNDPRPHQANRLLVLVKIMFEFAATKKIWTAANPCVDPATGRSLRKHEEHHRTRYCKDDEWVRIQAALKKESVLWQDFFEFMIATGMRARAVCRARWADIDLAGGIWNVPRGNMKGNKKSNEVVLDAITLRMLRRRLASVQNESPFLFAAPQSKGAKPLDVYKNAWKRVLKAAGLYTEDREERLRPHDLRRTFATSAIGAGVDTRTVNELLGNSSSSIAMTAKVYAQVTDEHRRTESQRTHASRRKKVAEAKKRLANGKRRARRKSD